MALWTPAEISTSLWLDAADASTLYDTSVGGSLVADGGNVGRWEDKSGNARHAIQATSGNRPVRSGTSVSFQDKWLSVPTAAFFLGQCVVGVLDSDATGWTSGGLLTIGSTPADNPDIRFGTVGGDNFAAYWGGGYAINQATGYGMLSSSVHAFAIETGIKITLWRNGTQTVTGTRAATWNPITEFTIGKFLRFPAEVGRYGTVRELVICSPSDRVTCEGYLAWKWGLQANLPVDHPYKNAAPLTGPYDVNGKKPVSVWIPSRDTAGNGTTTLNDLVGGNNGTLTNMDAATDWVADTGAGGIRALDFDGVNDYVNVPSSTTLNVSGAITVSAWFYAYTSPGDNQGIVAKWRTASPTNARQYIIGLGPGRLLFGGISSSGTFEASNFITSPTAVSALTWNHASLVFVPGVSISLYVNGVLAVSSATMTTTLFQGTAPLTIGHQSNVSISQLYFNGKIDDVRVFSQAFSASDIAYLYKGGFGRGIRASVGSPAAALRFFHGF